MILFKTLIFMKKYLQLQATGMLVALIIVLLGTVDALAQDRTISGSVKSSDDGQALPGVSVMIKGTTMGTVTDGDGILSDLQFQMVLCWWYRLWDSRHQESRRRFT